MPQNRKNRLKQKLNQLYRQYPRSIDLCLERLEALLHKLGDPHLHLPPTIHIAGTNGKGSTQAFMRSILEAHGKTVHAYTSPHLVDFNERIYVAGRHISDEMLLALIDEVLSANGDALITIFELTCAIAFVVFSREKADFLLLEVGLGGKYDATNVIPTAAATVITSISLDHQEFLGNDIATIAAEKAGIMKTNIPSFWAKQEPTVLAVLKQYAHHVGCSYALEGSQWHMDETLTLGLYGMHQYQNAALAMEVTRYILKDDFSIDAAKQGLAQTFWPARMQKINTGSLFAQLDNGHELWLDGAHNIHGAEHLAANIRQMQQQKHKPCYLMFAMLNNRDIDAYLRFFDGFFDCAIAMPITASSNGHKPEILVEHLQHYHTKSHICYEFSEAFALLNQMPAGRIIMTGSLYFLGSFLGQNQH